MNPPSDRKPFHVGEDSLVSNLSDMEVSMSSEAFKAKADAYKARASFSLGIFGRPSPRVSRGRSNAVSSFYHPHLDTPRPPRNDVNTNAGATPLAILRSSDTVNAKRGSTNPRALYDGKPRSRKTPASLPKILALGRSCAEDENLSPMLLSPIDIKTPHCLAGVQHLSAGSGTPRTNAVSPLRTMAESHHVKRPDFMSPLVKSPKKEQQSSH